MEETDNKYVNVSVIYSTDEGDFILSGKSEYLYDEYSQILLETNYGRIYVSTGDIKYDYWYLNTKRYFYYSTVILNSDNIYRGCV